MNAIILDSLKAVESLKVGDRCKLPNDNTFFIADIQEGSGVYLTTADSCEEEYNIAGYDTIYHDYIQHMRYTRSGPVIFGVNKIWNAISTGKYVIW